VINAASWDPSTTSVVPGELITLFGSGLSSANPPAPVTGGSPFPNTLGTTQVLVNRQAAPIYYVSPTQVSAVIPYEAANSTSYTAEIQVESGGNLSNQVSVYLADAEPGIFSQDQNGIGDAIAEHSDGSLVTEDNPAQPGETIVVALTGMGAVTPAVADGAVGPTNPLSYSNVFTTGELSVLFNDYVNNVTAQPAIVSYAGLYPGLAGLYQMNVTVPTTVGPGDVYIEVVTDAADVNQVTVCVTGPCTVSDPSTAARIGGAPTAKLPHPFQGPPHRSRTAAINRIRRLPSPARAPALPPTVPSPQN
jgi:uncharacterized protein (TIGR03437 family)